MPSFSKYTLITFIARIIFAVLLMVSSVIIAHFVRSGTGVMSIFKSIISISVLIAGFDIGASNVYFIGSQRYPSQLLIGTSFFIAIVTGSIVTILLSLFIPLLSQKFLDNEFHLLLYLVASLPVLQILTNYLSGILLGLRMIIPLNIV